MLVGDNTNKGSANTNKGGAADYCCSKCLLVKTPTRAVQTPTRALLPIIVVPNACW
jgi:hypothetical protein